MVRGVKCAWRQRLAVFLLISARVGSSDPIVADRLLSALRGRTLLGQQAASAPVYQFSIGPGSLADVLREFSRMTGVAVTLTEASVGRVTVDGLTGSFSAEEGLKKLIAGTQLSVRFNSATQAVVQLRVASESVDVTSSRPIDQVASTKYVAPVSKTPQTIQVIPRALIEEQALKLFRWQ